MIEKIKFVAKYCIDLAINPEWIKINLSLINSSFLRHSGLIFQVNFPN